MAPAQERRHSAGPFHPDTAAAHGRPWGAAVKDRLAVLEVRFDPEGTSAEGWWPKPGGHRPPCSPFAGFSPALAHRLTGGAPHTWA